MDHRRVGLQQYSGWLDLELITQCFSPNLEKIYARIERLAAHFCFRLARGGGMESWVPEAHYLRGFVADILREEGCTAEDCPGDESPRLYADAAAAHPEAAAIFELMRRCYGNASDFVTGMRTGVSIVFPRGDMSLWERVHRHDAVMSIYGSLVSPALEELLPRQARVLEVGAGVGAVLRKCLPILKERETREFWFTDLGRLFVQRAEHDFAGESMMRFGVLDLDRPVAAQGFEPGSFDLITGVNVLHSARDLEFSLRELRSCLREGGAVVLGEGSPPRRGRRWRLDFVFAFLRGWWDVGLDAQFRPRPGFLFPDEWLHLLRHCGYSDVRAVPGEQWFAGDCRGGLVVASK